MKIGIYSPYLDTVGGGEKYMLTIAETLSKENDVDIFLDTHLRSLDLKSITKKTSSLLNLNLDAASFINAPFGKGTNLWDRLNFLKNYDLFFYLTDGSIFYSTAKKSILHVQSPIQLSGNSLWRKIKSGSWDLIIYNSNFTKTHCQKFWKIKSEVLYPPVSTEDFTVGKKQKIILTVGRFYGYLKDKKHKLMIDAFKKMLDVEKISDWSFVLVGGAGEGDEAYVKELETAAVGYPIKILPNLSFKDLKKLYSETSIYWHASGFGETDPSKMEHFGITTVEAMASGAVPVVINKGGQTEIVKDNESGFLWDDPQTLIDRTKDLINDNKLMNRLSAAAIMRSQDFSKSKFIEKLSKILV